MKTLPNCFDKTAVFTQWRLKVLFCTRSVFSSFKTSGTFVVKLSAMADVTRNIRTQQPSQSLGNPQYPNGEGLFVSSICYFLEG